jgi:hypothetical protein
MGGRKAELLPLASIPVVFTAPAVVAAITSRNKARVGTKRAIDESAF